MKLFDRHIHPNLSQDAQGSIDEYARAAIEKGLSGICFTTHIDLNPHRKVIDRWVRINGVLRAYRAEYFEAYISEIKRTAERYKDYLVIETGFEFSYWPFFENLIENFIDRYRPDFTIGSLHAMDDVGFTAGSESYYPLRFFSPEEFLKRYADGIAGMTKFGRFDSIGHIDGYKKYAKRHWDVQQMQEAEKKIYPELFSTLAQNGQGIEINTSAVRKGFCDFYPRRELLQIAADFGVKISSIGSDAHRPNDVGFMLSEAVTLMEELGMSSGLRCFG